MSTDPVSGAKPHPHAPLLKYAIENFGADSSSNHVLTEQHQRFWTLAALSQVLGMPIHKAIPKVLSHQPQHIERALAVQLPMLFKLPDVQTALANSNPLDIASIMAAAGFTTFNSGILPQMNQLLRGAHFFMETRRSGLEAAIQQKQTVGVEIEFTPQPGMTRDHAYEALKARLEAAGHTVTLLEWGDIKDSDGNPSSRDFIYGAKPGIFPTIFGRFAKDSSWIDTQLLEATSSIMHTITTSPDDSVRLRANAETAEGAAEELYARVADALGTGSVDSVKHLMAQGAPNYTETRLYLLKDDTGDIAKIRVELRPDGKALLTGDNGLIYDSNKVAQASIEIDAPGTTDADRFKTVTSYFKEKVKNSHFAYKVDRYGALRIEGIDGDFKIVVEAHPDLELITPILKPDQGSIISLLIEGLRHGGFEGTRAANVVGVHVHAGLPMTFMDQNSELKFTVAPLVNLMRAFGQDAADITSAIPTHPNRKGFIHRIRPELIDLFNEPDYVKDPTDPKTILRVCADVVRLTRTKYTGLNLDNQISKLLGAMLLGDEKEGIAPVFKIGPDAEPQNTVYTSPIFGRLEYALQAVETEDGVNVRLLTLLPDIRPKGPKGEVLDYVEMIRIKKSGWKPTVEFRFFDTNLDNPAVAAIDMEFAAAYVAKLGTDRLIPPDKIRAMRQDIHNTPPPQFQPEVPHSQSGFITLDVMTLGAMSVVQKVMDSKWVQGIRNHFKQAFSRPALRLALPSAPQPGISPSLPAIRFQKSALPTWRPALGLRLR